MSITPKEFVLSIVRPACDALGYGGPLVERLLLGTAMKESNLRNIQQVGGPALGYFQMEPATHNDLHKNYLQYRGVLTMKLRTLLPPHTDFNPELLIAVPLYAAAMCRIKYLACPGAIPSSLEGQAAYYKKYYNTPLGAATEQEYINLWHGMKEKGELDGIWN